MADASKPQKRRRLKSGTASPDEQRTGDQQPKNHPVEEEPAAERGERIDGKSIARGGKEIGHVPGATEQPADHCK